MILDEGALRDLLACVREADGRWKVNSRERTDLEFKQQADENSLRKCLKTIAAFANGRGGRIVFGVSDAPRYVVGVEKVPDEAHIEDLLGNLSPLPDIEMATCHLDGCEIFVVEVRPSNRAPLIAIKDVQTKGEKNQTVLNQGVVYARRAGRTKPISGEEFGLILERRDNRIRQTILGMLARAEEVGFENVAVADFRKYGSAEENVTLWVPEGAAKELNIIDRARLVQDKGAPAYEIRGNVKLTMPSEKDPRKPLLPKKAARVLKDEVKKVFGAWFPWDAIHLRKAATHLGFWDNEKGDGANTGFESISERPLYYEAGRIAILRFARQNPDEFVEVVGSQKTQDTWSGLKAATTDGQDGAT